MAAAGSAAGLLRAGEGRKKNDPVSLLQTASRKQPAARNAAGCNPLEEEKVQGNVFLSFRRINHPSLRLPWKRCSSGALLRCQTGRISHPMIYSGAEPPWGCEEVS